MRLVQLEYFCAVCRCHSITKAAEELYVTQPTISVAIRELEKELKLRIFHHEKNRITLTKDGEAFYRRADALLRETRAMVTEFSSLGERKMPVRIGIPPVISTVFFPYLSDHFQEDTGIAVQLFDYDTARACRLVQEEKLDLALVNMNFYNLDQFNSCVLSEDSFVYCVGRNHRYAKLEKVDFDMLKDEKIILFNTDSVQNDTVLSRYYLMGITPDVLAYTSQLYTILNFLKRGDCGAFLYSTLDVDLREFVRLPVFPEITSRFGIIWKKGPFISERTMKFIEYVKK